VLLGKELMASELHGLVHGVRMIHTEAAAYCTATKKYEVGFSSLAQDIDVDVVVIAGGFIAINTALELAEKGVTRIAVLEAKYLRFGYARPAARHR
jgi:ribulose 1,5-bisphosphate synthetase/thiazole synthase